MSTKIEWVKNADGTPGKTWNPYHGCRNGCKYCYARAMAYRLKGRHGYPADDPFRPVFDESRLKAPYHWKKPTIIFVGSMGELDCVRADNFRKVLQVASENPRHKFLFLTHTPSALSYYNPWPDNAWVGCTATNSEEAARACWSLSNVRARICYLSLEPLLESISPVPTHAELKIKGIWSRIIDWIIIGRCTGPQARWFPTQKDWVQEIIDQAEKEAIPVFMKDNLRPLFPELKQEWPNGTDR